MSNDNTIYSYEDCFMYFRFGDVYSKQYNLFITNNNDRTIINGIGASTTFEAAAYQEGTYLVGTKSSQKTFKRKCAAKGISLVQYKEMMVWLTPGATGKLTFDSDIDWSWNVVLDTVGDATVFGDNENMVVEFEITWKTVGSYLATTTFDASLTLDSDDKTAINNRYGIPLIQMIINQDPTETSEDVITTVTTTMYIQSLGNTKQYLSYTNTLSAGEQHLANLDRVLTCNSGNGEVEYAKTKISSAANNKTRLNHIMAPQDLIFQYYGDFNITTLNNTLIGKSVYCDYDIQNNGIMELKGRAPIVIPKDKYNIYFNQGAISFIAINDPNVLDYIKYNNRHGFYTCACLAQLNEIDSNLFNQGDYNELQYPYEFTSILFLDEQINGQQNKYLETQTTELPIYCKISDGSETQLDPTKQQILTLVTCNVVKLTTNSKQIYTQTITAKVQSYNNL